MFLNDLKDIMVENIVESDSDILKIRLQCFLEDKITEEDIYVEFDENIYKVEFFDGKKVVLEDKDEKEIIMDFDEMVEKLYKSNHKHSEIINKTLEKIYTNFNEMLDKNLIEKIKNFFIDLGIQSEKKINALLKVIVSEIIDKKVEKIVDQVDPGNSKLKEFLEDVFKRGSYPLDETIVLLDLMEKREFIIKEDILKEGVQYEKNSLSELLQEKYLKTISAPGLDNILKSIFESTIKKNGQGRTGTGKGEWFLVLFGSGKVRCKNGDVCIKNIGIEVKAPGGSIGKLPIIPKDKLFKLIQSEDVEPECMTLLTTVFSKGANKNAFKTFIIEAQKRNHKCLEKMVKIVLIDRLDKKNFKEAINIAKKIIQDGKKGILTPSSLNDYISEWINVVADKFFELYQQQEKFDVLAIMGSKKGGYFYKTYGKNVRPKYLLKGFFTNGNASSFIEFTVMG